MALNGQNLTLAEQAFLENGRHYLETGGRKILTPCDEKARKEMDMCHNMLQIARKKRFFSAPIDDGDGQQARRILDVGTGTGIWAIEVADKYQTWEVKSLDLAMLQPATIPLNFRVYQADVEEDWANIQAIDRDYFDLIHIRCMYGHIRSWDRLYAEVFNHLRPMHGYIEHVEIDWTTRCDDGTMPPGWIISTINEDWAQAMDEVGRSARVNSQQTKDRLARAGFVDIVEEVIRLPINGWSADSDNHVLGTWVGATFASLAGHGGRDGAFYLEGRTLAALTRIKRRSAEEVHALLRRVAGEIPQASSTPPSVSRSPRHAALGIHAYMNLHIFSAKRP